MLIPRLISTLQVVDLVAACCGKNVCVVAWCLLHFFQRTFGNKTNKNL